MSALKKKLKALAVEGRSTLILDLGQVGSITSDVAVSLVPVLDDASTLGLRLAVCTPHERVGGA